MAHVSNWAKLPRVHGAAMLLGAYGDTKYGRDNVVVAFTRTEGDDVKRLEAHLTRNEAYVLVRHLRIAMGHLDFSKAVEWSLKVDGGTCAPRAPSPAPSDWED